MSAAKKARRSPALAAVPASAPSGRVAQIREVAARTRTDLAALQRECDETTGPDREDYLGVAALLLDVVSGSDPRAAIGGILRLARAEIEIVRHADFEFVRDGTLDAVLYNIENRLGLAAQLVDRLAVAERTVSQ
jgi:hypothetical protein